MEAHMTSTNRLEDLYNATEENFRFGIGVVALPGQPAVPIIQVYYRDWTREQLEVVRESFADGLILVSGERTTGKVDLYIATRQKIMLQLGGDGHTSAAITLPRVRNRLRVRTRLSCTLFTGP
jgi:hypothetical protein